MDDIIKELLKKWFVWKLKSLDEKLILFDKETLKGLKDQFDEDIDIKIDEIITMVNDELEIQFTDIDNGIDDLIEELQLLWETVE